MMEKIISIDEPTAVALKLVLRKLSIGQMITSRLESDEIEMLFDLLNRLENETR